MKTLSLFDGISCGRIALERVGIEPEFYMASEICQDAIKVSKDNYKNIWRYGDVRKLNCKNVSIDLLMAGSPCQGFSRAGLNLGFEDDRSSLYSEFLRIKNEVSPKYWILENVKMHQNYIDKINFDLGVKGRLINSSFISAQNRPRYYWTNIPISPLFDKYIYLKSIIGDYDGIQVAARGGNRGGLQHYNKKSPCITTSCWEHNFKPVINGVPRLFTVNEAEMIQTLPIGYTRCLSNNKAFKVIGNCWTVDVIAHILAGIK